MHPAMQVLLSNVFGWAPKVETNSAINRLIFLTNHQQRQINMLETQVGNLLEMNNRTFWYLMLIALLNVILFGVIFPTLKHIAARIEDLHETQRQQRAESSAQSQAILMQQAAHQHRSSNAMDTRPDSWSHERPSIPLLLSKEELPLETTTVTSSQVSSKRSPVESSSQRSASPLGGAVAKAPSRPVLPAPARTAPAGPQKYTLNGIDIGGGFLEEDTVASPERVEEYKAILARNLADMDAERLANATGGKATTATSAMPATGDIAATKVGNGDARQKAGKEAGSLIDRREQDSTHAVSTSALPTTHAPTPAASSNAAPSSTVAPQQQSHPTFMPSRWADTPLSPQALREQEAAARRRQGAARGSQRGRGRGSHRG